MNQDNNLDNQEMNQTEEVQNGSENTDTLSESSEDVSVDMQSDEQVDEAVDQTSPEDEVNEWKDKYLRLVAEFDNYKKRTNRERIELIQTAGKDVIASLLDVVDDMDRAEQQMNESEPTEEVMAGIRLVFNKFRNTLKNQGLQSFESINQPFDVELHEAITEVPVPTDDMAGKVVDEVQKGYYLNDKLLRHAKVVVGKKQ